MFNRRQNRRQLWSWVAAFTLAAAGTAQAQDVIRVATDATFPPFEYTENGKRTAQRRVKGVTPETPVREVEGDPEK